MWMLALAIPETETVPVVRQANSRRLTSGMADAPEGDTTFFDSPGKGRTDVEKRLTIRQISAALDRIHPRGRNGGLVRRAA